jgi:serine/threonine-protein kinase
MPPRIPAQIGHFKVLGLLGKGAMGEVYEGVDEGLDRRVALKVLGRKHQESGEFKTRFLREGRALAAINHANVVQVYFIGEFDRRPFLAMEYLDGYDIGAALKKDGPVRPGDAAEVIRQSAIGLSETQRAGVVHRDVKPSNLVVTQDGVVKVTDFGLAKALQEDLSITATGVFVGTPDYLAPEQAMGEDVDAAADVYALGCTLFHMCSGYPPFRKGGADDHYTAVVRRHLKSDRPVLKEEFPGFDEELSDLCRRMMSRRPDVRPDFDELVAILGPISKRLRGQVPPRHSSLHVSSAENPVFAPPPAAAPAEAPSVAVEATPASNRGMMIGIGIGVGVGAILTFLALNM